MLLIKCIRRAVALFFLAFVLGSAAEQPVSSFQEVRCLATTVYYEAQGEPMATKIAVAEVVMNRVRDGFAPSACKVITQKSHGSCQFPWTCHKYKWIDYKQCKDCWAVANKIYNEEQIRYSSILYFHALNEHPNWQKYKFVATIGRLKFFRK